MFNFENGKLIKEAYVEINGVKYPVHMPEYEGNTPLTSENLNKMQKDLAQEIKTEINNTIAPEVLFQGSTQVDFVLSDEISNYKKITIYYYDNNGSRYSTTIENTGLSNDITVALEGQYNSGNYYNTKLRMYRIQGRNAKGFGQANFEYSNKSISYNNNITVTLIEGYKKDQFK